MKTLVKFVVGAVATSALVFGGAPAVLAAPPGSPVTFTLDADGTSLPLADAAADWSKNTGIAVRTGDCTGSNCVHFKMVQSACGYGAPVGGCAYRVSDGSCTVEVTEWAVSRGGYLDDLITKHEAGHCLWSYLGISQSYHLPDKPHALMSATHSLSPSQKEATLTSTDRRFTKSLVG